MDEKQARQEEFTATEKHLTLFGKIIAAIVGMIVYGSCSLVLCLFWVMALWLIHWILKAW